MYDIIIGRSKKDVETFGLKGTVFLGKQYVTMGQYTSLSNKVYLDVSRSHCVFICGKRGSGKSYTMGVIAEGIASLPDDVKYNLSAVILDTMGVYWSMKYPNKEDEKLLRSWGLEPKGLDVKVFTPFGFYDDFKKKGVPTDRPFSIKPSDLTSEDWLNVFEIERNTEVGAFLERVINDIKEQKQNFSIDEILDYIDSFDYSNQIKLIIQNHFQNAKTLGLFSKNGTELNDIIKSGQISVIDVSCYASLSGSNSIKALAIGIIAQKSFQQRMLYRREEELNEINSTINFLENKNAQLDLPLVWFIIDEAHEFLPKEGKTGASNALITILREGRQPGISLILATQQPGKIHTDVITQSDIVISHRLTAKIDIDSLGLLMQSYMREGLDQAIDALPREGGAAIVFDDMNERLFPLRVCPRISWHGGSTATALREKKLL